MLSNYIVIITDQDNKEIEVPVSKEVFKFLVEADRSDMRVEWTLRKNLEHLEMTDALIYDRMVQARKSQVEEEYIVKEEVKRIMRVLSTCTEKQRRRFFLHVLEGKSHAAIAKMEGCSRGSVQQAYLRLIRKIKEELEK